MIARFPQKDLYFIRLALRVGILKLLTMIVILALKYYAEYKIDEDNITKILKIKEENVRLHHKCDSYLISACMNANQICWPASMK